MGVGGVSVPTSLSVSRVGIDVERVFLEAFEVGFYGVPEAVEHMLRPQP